jgi:hypothetical protein
MSWDNQKLILWALTFVSLILGIIGLIDSIIALKNRNTVSIYPDLPNEIQISPWTGLVISGAFLTYAIIGIIKIWKDKGKYPPL